MDAERLTYTVSEVARLLGLSRNSAYQGIVTGEIPHIKVGKRILIPCLAFQRMLEGKCTANKRQDVQVIRGAD
ncbi:helix-turn-helix domain-containing protein [Chloroflexota bacterium]